MESSDEIITTSKEATGTTIYELDALCVDAILKFTFDMETVSISCKKTRKWSLNLTMTCKHMILMGKFFIDQNWKRICGTEYCWLEYWFESPLYIIKEAFKRQCLATRELHDLRIYASYDKTYDTHTDLWLTIRVLNLVMKERHKDILDWLVDNDYLKATDISTILSHRYTGKDLEYYNKLANKNRFIEICQYITDRSHK